MKVFDENLNLIENPDLTKGRIEESYRPITHHYEITRKEVGHYEVIKAYPNGGKDVAWVVDVPEKGRWVTCDADGNEIKTNNIIPEDAPHENVIEDHELIGIYKPYTEEELAELAEMSKETISQLDMIEAQVTYTAMMTDTLLGV